MSICRSVRSAQGLNSKHKNVRVTEGFYGNGIISYPNAGWSVIAGAENLILLDAKHFGIAQICGLLIARCMQLANFVGEKKNADKIWQRADIEILELFEREVSPTITASDWLGHMAYIAIMHGNSYALILRNGKGKVVGLQPFPIPLATQVKMRVENGEVVVEYVYENKTFPAKDVLHFRGTSAFDSTGLQSLSVLEIARDTFSRALKVEEFGSSFFDNAAVPSMVLSYPTAIGDKVRSEVINSMSALKNAGRYMPFVVTDGGNLSLPQYDASKLQILDLRRFAAQEIIGLYGVPSTLTGLGDETVWGTGIVSLVRTYHTTTLLPRCISWGQEISAKLLPKGSRVRLDMSELLQGSLDEIAKALKSLQETGLFGADELREVGGFPPLGKTGSDTNASRTS